MAQTKKTPRGDASAVKKYGNTYMPVPYGPSQKLKQAKHLHLSGERKGYNA